MATKARKKSGAAGKKRKTVGSITLSGIKYTKSSCHTTPGAAKAEAKKIREGGHTARVIGKCVFKGRKRK